MSAPVKDRVLEAARACVLALGWRRTTLSDVARRAGVARSTVYRKFPDMTAVYGELLTREWGEILAGAPAGQAAGGEAGAIARQVAHIVAGARSNPLFRRAFEVDPDLLLPYLFERRGRSQQLSLDLLVAEISRAQTSGGVRAGDPAVLARAVLLTAEGFLISLQTVTDEEGPAEAVEAQLAELVEKYLAP